MLIYDWLTGLQSWSSWLHPGDHSSRSDSMHLWVHGTGLPSSGILQLNECKICKIFLDCRWLTGGFLEMFSLASGTQSLIWAMREWDLPRQLLIQHLESHWEIYLSVKHSNDSLTVITNCKKYLTLVHSTLWFAWWKRRRTGGRGTNVGVWLQQHSSHTFIITIPRNIVIDRAWCAHRRVIKYGHLIRRSGQK